MTTPLATARSWLPGTARSDRDVSPRTEPLDWLVATAALLFPLAYFDAFFVPSFTPRMALVILLIPVGAARWIRSAARGDPASIAGAATVVLCGLATIIADAPLWNLRGGFARESSLVFLAGFFAIWALARECSPDGRRLVCSASLVGLALTGVVGWIQLLVEPTGFLQMIGSRPSGLLVNPVYFGPAMAGAAVLIAHLWARDVLDVRLAAAAVVFFTATVNLSGSRAGLLGFGVGLTGALVAARGVRIRALMFGSVLAGFVISLTLTTIGSSSGRSTVERAGGGSDGRWDVWTYAWAAFRDRPLTGYGLGQFRAAVQTHFEPEFVREYLSSGGGVAWPDAHNVIVQYAVVGGVVTVASLFAFAVFAGRVARGPAAWATLALTISWLLQPVTLVTAPIAAIWLGLADAEARATTPTTDLVTNTEQPPDTHVDDVSDHEPTGPTRRTDVLLVIVGALVALGLIGLDRQLDDAASRGDAAALTTWAEIAPDDPVIAATTASVNTRQGRRDVGLDWSALGVELEPKDAVVITEHAIRLFDAGHADESTTTIRRALDVDPYHPYALQVAGAIARAVGDDELILLVETNGCPVLDELCDLSG